MTKCYICQKNPIGSDPDKLLCDTCFNRMFNTKEHVHEFKPFKFSPDSNITYYDCECGERRMVATEAK